MLDIFKNPFKKSNAQTPRKSAEKEAKDIKEEAKVSKTDTSNKKLAIRPSTVKAKEEAKVSKTVDKKSDVKTNLGAGYGVILKPHVSEKTAKAGGTDTYAFVVARDTNKVQVKKAFWSMYGIKPESIQIVNMGERATQFRRIKGKKTAWKKAYIRVPKGSNIAVYEGV